MTEAARAAAADPAGLHIDSSVPLDVNGVPHGQPVLDHFKRIDERSLLGVMNGKGVLDDGRFYYFVLDRDEDGR